MSRRLNLTRAQREQIDAIRAVLKPWGLASELCNDGPHLAVKVHGPRGGAWRLVVAGTPRDLGNAVKLATANARRLVRAINEGVGY